MLWVVTPVLLLFADTVSVRELAVPQKARDKYEDAQRKLARHDSEGARRKLDEAVALAPRLFRCLERARRDYQLGGRFPPRH